MTNSGKNDFFSERYLENIQLLQDKGLWDFETGPILLPLLQYCMPPPSIADWKRLIDHLVDLDLNTDWAPSAELRALQKKLHDIDSGLSAREMGINVGTEFPVFYGIAVKQLNDQWPDKKKREFIIQFTEIAYLRTAPKKLLSSKGRYYRHVYCLRDVLICNFSDQLGLVETSDSANNRNKKYEETQRIRADRGWLGSELHGGDHFWATPPHVPFTQKQKPPSNKKSPDSIPELHDPIAQTVTVDDTGRLDSIEQEARLRHIIPRWIRNNVRSYSDPNQLTWASILFYWRWLIKRNKHEQLLISLLALVTGIQRQRWNVAEQGSTAELTEENLILDSEAGCLRYVIHNSAEFFGGKKLSQASSAQMILQLPAGLNKYLKNNSDVFSKGLNDAYSIRAFANKRPGPTPTIDRMANSGLILFRKQYLEETEAFVIAGRIPIEYRARNCYVTRNSQELNRKFHRSLQGLLSTLLEYHLKPNEDLAITLKSILSANEPILKSQLLGSQLGHPTPKLKSSHVKCESSTPLRAAMAQQNWVARLNNVEANYYWMIQFAYANRPVGEKTNAVVQGRFRLHEDKESRHFVEPKLLVELPLISQQYDELFAARKTVIRQFKRWGYLPQSDLSNSPLALFHQINQQAGSFDSKPLNNKKAIQFAQKAWGYETPYDRPNASRHQCSTHINWHFGSAHADTWLGHHIDGWYFSAPEASGSVSILDELAEAQQKWMKQIGLNVIENPFR